MRIYLDTTIHELFDSMLISVRTYNCLRYAGMVTLDDVLNYAESPMELMNLKNFGRKSYTEIEPLLREVQTGRSIVSKEKASDYLPPADRLGELPEEIDEK